MAVGPAVTDTEHEVRSQQSLVAVAVRGLQTHHAGHQRVIVSNCAPAHQGWNHRDVDQLGKLLQQLGRVGVDHAAAGDDQRTLRCVQQFDGFFSLGASGARLVRF